MASIIFMFVYFTLMEATPLPKEIFPLVSIVILNWNGQRFLQQFLPSIFATSYPNYKVIIADNASTDDSAIFIEENYPDARFLKLKENYGYAKGYNEALKQIDGKYYVLLNNDVEVEPNWLNPIIDLLETNAQIAACQPKLLMYEDRSSFEYAGASGGWIDVLGYPFARGRVFDFVEKDVGQYDEPQACFWASGAALVIRSDLFHKAGGFDDYFFAHQEEIDLCWRLKNRGFEIYCLPQSVVYHLGGGTLNKSNPHKTFLNFRNNLIMLYKNSSYRQIAWKFPLRILLDLVAFIKTLFQNPSQAWAILRAHLAFIHWLFFKHRHTVASVTPNLEGMVNKSLVWQYFIRKKKTFKEIIYDK